jgi:hypothetical protein
MMSNSGDSIDSGSSAYHDHASSKSPADRLFDAGSHLFGGFASELEGNAWRSVLTSNESERTVIAKIWELGTPETRGVQTSC